MNDDYEWCDEACPKCAHAPSHVRDCTVLGCDEGSVDGYEDDPINADPGDFSACSECRGTGIEHWCPKCGYDFVWKRGAATASQRTTGT